MFVVASLLALLPLPFLLKEDNQPIPKVVGLAGDVRCADLWPATGCTAL